MSTTRNRELAFELFTRNSLPRADARQDEPLVSIVMFVRNRATTVRRAIESVLTQNYPNIQLVVQDGVSTDGTLEVLKSYGSKIDLVSEPDAGVHDAFWRALRRVNGEIIGTCLSDEQLTPGAIKRGVDELLAAPKAGAVTGDALMSDYSNRVFNTWTGQDFDFLAYLIGDYCPHFSSTFFRRSALQQVGLFDSPWKEGRKEPVEFEIWCRLGMECQVKYVPHFFYKYGYDAGQLSQDIGRIIEELDYRTAMLDSFLFGKDNFFGENKELRDFIVQRQHEILVTHLTWNKNRKGAMAVEAKMYERLGRAVPPKPRWALRAIRTGDFTLLRGLASGLRRAAFHGVKRVARKTLDALMLLSPLISRESSFGRFVRRVHRRVRAAFLPANVSQAAVAPAPPPPDTFRARLYVYAAKCYRARGLIGQALQMYRKAESISDATIDAEACQLALTSPEYDDADLEQLHRRWSTKHAVPIHHVVHGVFAKRERKRIITIGYHCIFWNNFCADALALSFIAKHDRERFRVIGYSPWDEPQHVQEHFDAFRAATEKHDHAKFADLVRADDVDIFVELSGLSHYNRFGAMALRCAPIQVNYVNHLGTTQVANVDYVIGDAITFPRVSELYFSETIDRLPRCLLTYDYESASMPEVCPPPVVRNGFVTFGSFGGPYKLNNECIELWAAVMRATPGSRLLIQNEGMTKKANGDFIARQFGQHGIHADRLTILPGISREENLLNYSMMDMSLDTWPYCGGNSVAEALWQGVPVVTLKGPRAVSAYGAALVSAVGLSDLVAHTPAQYVDIAARLAADKARLVQLRTSLRSMAREHGLADSTGMARALEGAFTSMMDRRFGREASQTSSAYVARQADRAHAGEPRAQ